MERKEISSADFVREILDKRGVDVEILHTIAQLTKTGLDRPTLAIVLDLIENGIDAESISHVIQEIRLSTPIPTNGPSR